MASYTPNYNLKKPADSDYYDIADDNGNMDKIDTALNTLNAKINTVDGEMGYEASDYVSNQDIVNVIKGFINNGSNGGTFMAISCTNTPDSTKNYKIRYTRNNGTQWVLLEAHDATNVGNCYVNDMNPSTSAIGTWNQYALKSKFAWTTYLSESNVSVGDAYASTGKTFTLTSVSLVRIDMSYTAGRPLAIGVKSSESAGSASVALNSVYGDDIADTSGLSVTAILTAGTYYVWARTASATGKTNITVTGMPLGA